MFVAAKEIVVFWLAEWNVVVSMSSDSYHARRPYRESSTDCKIQMDKRQWWPHGLLAKWTLGCAVQKQHSDDCWAANISQKKE